MKDIFIYAIAAIIMALGANKSLDYISTKTLIIVLVFYCTFSGYYFQNKVNDINKEVKYLNKILDNI